MGHCRTMTACQSSQRPLVMPRRPGQQVWGITDLVPFAVGVGKAWTLATGILTRCGAPALAASASPAAAVGPTSWTGVSEELSFRVTFPATLSDMGLTCRRRAVTWNSSTDCWFALWVYRSTSLIAKPDCFLQIVSQLASSVLRRRTTSWFLFWASRSLSWCCKIILNKLKQYTERHNASYSYIYVFPHPTGNYEFLVESELTTALHPLLQTQIILFQ